MLGFINYVLSLNQQREEINISLNWCLEVPSHHHFVILCMFRKHEWKNSSKNLLFQQCLQTLFKHVKKQVASYDLSHVLVVEVIVLFEVTIMVNGVTQLVIIPRANCMVSMVLLLLIVVIGFMNRSCLMQLIY